MATAFGQECPANYPAHVWARDATAHAHALPTEAAVQFARETPAELPSAEAEGGAEASGSHMRIAVGTALMLGGAIVLSTAVPKAERDYTKGLSKEDLSAVQVVIMAAELDVPITAELIGALMDKTPAEASAYFRHLSSLSIFEPENPSGIQALRQVRGEVPVAFRLPTGRSYAAFGC
jgi:hypothetical protein